MKFVIIVALGLIGLGVYFFDDISRSVSEASAGRGSSGPSVARSAGNMGSAMNNNMGSVNRSLGQ